MSFIGSFYQNAVVGMSSLVAANALNEETKIGNDKTVYFLWLAIANTTGRIIDTCEDYINGYQHPVRYSRSTVMSIVGFTVAVGLFDPNKLKSKRFAATAIAIQSLISYYQSKKNGQQALIELERLNAERENFRKGVREFHALADEGRRNEGRNYAAFDTALREVLNLNEDAAEEM